MQRRKFLGLTAIGTASATVGQALAPVSMVVNDQKGASEQLKADLVIAGGGLGGVAAALAALRNGMQVILTEETDWIGGQMTSQGVPPDEHPWIETHGAPVSYRQLRDGIRDYYRKHYSLTPEAAARPHLNPGDGAVSRLCHEPRVAHAVMLSMLAPWLSNCKLMLLTEHRPVAAEMSGDRVQSLTVKHTRSNSKLVLSAPWFVDATELGDLLPLTGTEYVTGAESKAETGELHAADLADATNQQAFTMCFAMDYVPGSDHVIARPDAYSFWRDHVPKLSPSWPGRLLDLTYTHPSTLKPKTLGFHPEGIATGDALNLWNYRRIIHRKNFRDGFFAGDISIVNWPQNDYMLGSLIDVSEKTYRKHVDAASQLSLSLLYWLQTEVPRPDGGKGWRGLRLRPDILGTSDGLAKYPYVRESRRIKAMYTIREQDCGKEQSGGRAAHYVDSVGIGYYHIDLHPSTGGNNYIDFPSLPFEIPLGALIPVRVQNLLPANKNIGTTHITNGCYRLHPVEWSIGEAVGCLCAFVSGNGRHPKDVRQDQQMLTEFQRFLHGQGIETGWPPSK
jgi:hypothetical protein